MSLKQRLIEQITLEGPISVADYMARCLLDPIDGYYTRRPGLGADGDFITAPMVSQMFGEMIGVWVAETWTAMGSPPFRLVEIGGGDGTLMSDILRVTARVPGLKTSARITMVEPSPVLRARQATAVPDAEFLPVVEALPDDLPLIIVANEVLDCLPARQYVRVNDGWHERMVGVRAGVLVFGLAPEKSELPEISNCNDGDLFEYSPEQVRFTRTLCDKLKANSGAALLIDYGRAHTEPGDTLQALHRHQKHDPLAAPGDHDLTVWADFPAVAAAAARASITTSNITPQAAFLRYMGIDARLEALKASNPSQADKLQRQYDRLVAPDQMGELFKVLAFAYPASIPLIGLEAEVPGS
ncbi:MULTISPECIES: class I SAM-dependent methyltransferase [Asticcacaulis]|uniref:class I SAM-dependent methyltransferase n=1 Tax=Asticcacaulis TaxID=76890 RepID=UPI001AE47EFD|nr:MULTISPECIES: SAM-dependent methyltransferase [Asticcacaulis]MBP2158643.1 SAM-dependent MidA family methyltransferase [Asticcacaulis solisilvae]MDR6799689.1 SAM-dependent MidA family methyltransferase [Asticcacaulis sp. BE141]